VQAVDVLLRRNRLHDALGVQPLGQRQLDENAVHARVRVEFANQAE